MQKKSLYLMFINYVIRIFNYSPCALKDMLICNYNGECSFNFKERQKQFLLRALTSYGVIQFPLKLASYGHELLI